MIVCMKRVFTIFVSLLTSIHSVCFGDSLLMPAKFPKTFSDVDFISKTKLKTEDYDRYATLTPYEKFILEKADENIEQQIAYDLAMEEQNDTAHSQQQDTNDPSTSMDTTASTQQNTTPTTNTTAPTTPTQSSAQSQPTTPVNTNVNGGYCAVRQPRIPQNQKIPFGSPVLHEHFIYCSPYANLNRGSGPRPHTGYDIGCTLESFDRPIFTPADGVVKLVKPNQRGGSAGNYVIVDHGNGFQTWYLHLNQILVTQGQHVSAGCQIATIGNTGASLETRNARDPDPRFRKSLSHLHYEIRYTGSLTSVTTGSGKKVLITHGWANNTSIDPTQFICVYDNFKHGYCGKTFPYQ